MPNAIKYNTNAETLALKKGNFWIGTGDVGKGPSSSTGFYNGLTPTSGGYVIYSYNPSLPGNTAYFTVANDSQLISYTNGIAGTSYTTANECLVYYAGQTDKVCVNIDYPPIVTNGLVLNLDAGFTPSYPRTNATWYDLSSGGNNGTLINGPTFNSGNGGSIVFDGTNDYVTINQTLSTPITICGFVKYNNQSQTLNTWINSFPHAVLAISLNRLGGGQIYVYIGNSYGWQGQPGIISSTNMTVNTWYHLAYVSNGSGSVLYLNGVNVGTSIHSPSGWGLKYFLGWIELNGNGEYLNGNIGNTQIYNRALSQTEIIQNYNALKSRYGL
jgi:hypothetical protein